MKKVADTNKENHHRLWQWLGDHPKEEKHDWPEWDYNGGQVQRMPFLCFACDEATLEEEKGILCKWCPCEWGPEKILCLNRKSPYFKWDNAKTPKTRKRWAYATRDAWREGKEGGKKDEGEIKEI